jgi:hypothetical protein
MRDEDEERAWDSSISRTSYDVIRPFSSSVLVSQEWRDEHERIKDVDFLGNERAGKAIFQGIGVWFGFTKGKPSCKYSISVSISVGNISVGADRQSSLARPNLFREGWALDGI